MKRPEQERPRARPILAALLVCLTGVTAATGTSWELDRGPSAVGFKVSHLIFSEVEGRFSRFSGSVELPGEDFEAARIEADIDVTSIYTGHQDRDLHLVSDEFLFAEEFPQIQFVSRSIQRTGPDSYEIVGDLTIREITREIVLAAESMGRRVTTTGLRLDFQATGSLSRQEFGLRWNKIWDGRAVLGDKVEISLKICLLETR